LFEAKTGHQKFPYYDKPSPNMRAVKSRRDQFQQQSSVAYYCGYAYFVAVETPRGAAAIKRAIPEAPIFHVPYGGG
jgi:hypothetical protein